MQVISFILQFPHLDLRAALICAAVSPLEPCFVDPLELEERLAIAQARAHRVEVFTGWPWRRRRRRPHRGPPVQRQLARVQLLLPAEAQGRGTRGVPTRGTVDGTTEKARLIEANPFSRN